MTAAFFDLDLTIVMKDSFQRFILYLYFQKQYLKWMPWLLLSTIQRKLRFISLEKFKVKLLRPLSGYHESEIKQIGDKYLEKYISEIMSPNILSIIQWHKKNNHLLILATSCPDIYLQSFCYKLGFDTYVGTGLKFINSRFTGEFSDLDLIGEKKVEKLKPIINELSINLKKSYAYSDNESDLPLLNLVANPHVIHPTKKLETIAKEKGWPISSW